MKAEKTPPSSLQWDVILPAKWRLLEATTKPAHGVRAEGKTLRCAPSDPNPKDGRSVVQRCILAGGRELIENGDVAEIHLGIPSQAGEFKISIQNATGVSTDLKVLKFAACETKITVQ